MEIEPDKILLDPHKDQHFLIDEGIIAEMISAAGVTPDDIILDIGAGTGNITKIVARTAKKVIAVEKDAQFEEDLRQIPKVVVEIQDILDFCHEQKEYTKIVSNIPFQLCEPLMHVLCQQRRITVAVLIVPLNYVPKLEQHPIFSAFLQIEKMREVPKTAFYPSPSVKSMLIRLKYRSDSDPPAFWIRQLYLQRDKKLKNALREILILYYWSTKKKEMSKKEATEKIQEWNISPEWLDQKIEHLSLHRYPEIVGKVVPHL